MPSENVVYAEDYYENRLAENEKELLNLLDYRKFISSEIRRLRKEVKWMKE